MSEDANPSASSRPAAGSEVGCSPHDPKRRYIRKAPVGTSMHPRSERFLAGRVATAVARRRSLDSAAFDISHPPGQRVAAYTPPQQDGVRRTLTPEQQWPVTASPSAGRRERQHLDGRGEMRVGDDRKGARAGAVRCVSDGGVTAPRPTSARSSRTVSSRRNASCASVALPVLRQNRYVLREVVKILWNTLCRAAPTGYRCRRTFDPMITERSWSTTRPLDSA